MEDEELVPDPELMESMRAVGYSLKTAIADICDNAISAKASFISIQWDVRPTPHVTFFDNGDGMSRDTLRLAMKLAGKSPMTSRGTDDLGRFGLGLKTASLSQARSLSVISRQAGITSAAKWDLDYLKATGKWTLQWMTDEEIATTPNIDKLNSVDSGTLIFWQELDLLLDEDDFQGSFLATKFDEAASHLGLVFHRFLNSRVKRLEILVNGASVPTFDPFLDGEPGVVDRGSTSISINGETVVVHPFILPSLNKMTRPQKDKALFDGSKMREAQGFYVYRNMRLLTWGTWFRLVPMDETGKLARVRVDTGNSLDADWKLGITKSEVQPPKSLRDALKRLVPQIVDNSARASRGKSSVKANSVGEIWRINELGNKAFELVINEAHPLVSGFAGELEDTQRRTFQAVLKMLETNFPATYVHQRLSKDNSMREGLRSDEEIWAVAQALFEQLASKAGGLDSEIWQMVEAIEPFHSDSQLKSRLRAIRNGESN
jgi:hypothetical protein